MEREREREREIKKMTMHDCPNSRVSQDKATWFDPFHLICQLSGQKQYRDSQTSSSSLP